MHSIAQADLRKSSVKFLESYAGKLVGDADALSDTGYESLYFLTDVFALVMMDIMSTIKTYCLGIHLTGKLHAVINPAA